MIDKMVYVFIKNFWLMINYLEKKNIKIWKFL
jgi:hypothetical protein